MNRRAYGFLISPEAFPVILPDDVIEVERQIGSACAADLGLRRPLPDDCNFQERELAEGSADHFVRGYN